jgi:hypothetical protein
VSGRLILAGAAVVALAVAHMIVLGFAAKLLALPVAAAAGLGALAVAKHLGLLAPLVAWMRRQAGRGPTPRS